jgi:hypothetical protein
MMRRRTKFPSRALRACLVALALVPVPAVLAESVRQEEWLEDAPRSWLGLDLAKPDPIVARQLPSLPAGVGFVVRSVEMQGPAGKAGVRAYDIVWKFNDQWLVNEGQLAALLRLSPPGSRVVLSGFRSGKAVEFPLVLGDAAGRKGAVPEEIVQGVLVPSATDRPIRLIRMEDRTAFYREGDEQLEVRKVPGGYAFQISDGTGTVRHEGTVPEHGGDGSVPEAWRQRVKMLCRGLDHQLAQGLVPGVPRARVLPPKPVVKPAVAGPSSPGAGSR